MSHYEPGPVPAGIPQRVQLYLADELRKIAIAFGNVNNLKLEPRAAEPARYSDGMIVYANGTDWDPGGGAGVYAREGGAWVKL